MYDIIIVGSGPAGANLARLIGDKYKTLIIEKRELQVDNSGHNVRKCCGGLLAPDAQKMIARLGLGIPKDILVDPQLFAVRTIDLTNNLERLYQRFYYNMDREKFDKWLVSILPGSIDINFNSIFKGFLKIPGGFEVRYSSKGREACERTRIIVGADGAFSKVRRLINRGINTPDMYISIQEWFEGSCSLPYYTAIFDKEISDFYSWIIPKDNYMLLGSALKPGTNAIERYNTLKGKLTRLGFDFNNKILTEGAYICRPCKVSQLYEGRDNIALIGEAAGAISPSSAEGISYALKSSLYLAQSLEEGTDGFMERYVHRMRDIRTNLFIKNIKAYAMYNSLPRQLVMKSGILSIR